MDKPKCEHTEALMALQQRPKITDGEQQQQQQIRPNSQNSLQLEGSLLELCHWATHDREDARRFLFGDLAN